MQIVFRHKFKKMYFYELLIINIELPQLIAKFNRKISIHEYQHK